MTVVAHGRLRAWADGWSLTVEPVRTRDDGASEFRVTVARPVDAAVVVALRVEQERGAYGGAALPEPIALDCAAGHIELGDWTQQGVLECYSGGAWYRKDFTLTPELAGHPLTLDLGSLSASAAVRVNGKPAGTRVAPPWRFDVSGLANAGTNHLEILILSTLGGHYTTIPTRYPGSKVSGLLGPVTLQSVQSPAPTTTAESPRR